MSSVFARMGATSLIALLLGSAAMAAEHNPVRRPAAAVESTSIARVIVKYRADGTLGNRQAAAVGTAAQQPLHAAAMSQRLGIKLTDGRVLGTHTEALMARGLSSAALAAQLSADNDVEYAVPDERRYALAVPNDPLEGLQSATASPPTVGQWYLRAPAAPALAAINAEAAWDVTTGSSSVIVAVLDSGVRFDHPDLVGKLYPGYDFVSNTARAADGDGRDSDASDPGDAITQVQIDADPTDFGGCSASNSSWHGTQVSGLIGATTNNGVGIASVGYNTMVLPVRVLGRCGGTDSDIIAGMLWAAGISTDPSLPANPRPAQVLNLSLGSAGACSAAYVDAFNRLAVAQVLEFQARSSGGMYARLESIENSASEAG